MRHRIFLPRVKLVISCSPKPHMVPRRNWLFPTTRQWFAVDATINSQTTNRIICRRNTWMGKNLGNRISPRASVECRGIRS